MKIFLDSDILLDVVLDRNDGEQVAKALSRAQSLGVELCTSAIVMVNVHYVARKSANQQKVFQLIGDWLHVLSIAPTTTQELQHALSYGMDDWEDAVQLATAKASGCTHLVTRNVKDFTHSTQVKIVSPIILWSILNSKAVGLV